MKPRSTFAMPGVLGGILGGIGTVLLAGCTTGEVASVTPPALGIPSPAAPLARDASAPVDATGDAAVLAARPGASRYALVGEAVVLDASASTGATTFDWDFGDGRRSGPSPSPTASVSYGTPGRYTVVLTARDDGGATRTGSLVLSVTTPATFSRSESATLVSLPDKGLVAVVSEDANEVVFFGDRTRGLAEVTRIAVGPKPRTVTRFNGLLAVPCQDDDSVAFVPEDGSGAPVKVALPFGARPYGAAAIGDELFVTLTATGRVARIRYATGAPTVVDTFAVAADARAIAALPGGRLAVTSWRSPEAGGVVTLVSNLDTTPTTETVALAKDTQLASDTEIGGIPSYLGHVAVSPTGSELALPSLQANVIDGVLRSGRDLTFETTLRAITSFVDLGAKAEVFSRRKQFDNRGLASAATYSSRGDFLYVVMPGNGTVERLDVLTEVPSGNISQLGYAADGVALSSDDQTLYVNVPLSRELLVFDTSAFDTPAAPVARLALVKAEPLPADVLRGKQLFNDAADARLSKDGYIACAHCHLEGDSDRRVWDFTGRGEGLRNTTSLLGRAGLGDGPLHWSANFDEVQDFEHDIREAFGGKGLMADADFLQGTRNTKLGDKKAGVSTELDALAAYVTSLSAVPRSPSRPGAGQLTTAAARGEAVFASAGCDGCHAGPRMTDSGWFSPGVPRLHDVGTLAAGSGQRLGGPLLGLDTPTLRGVFATPPYLHDGSAATLDDVLLRLGTQHTSRSLTANERADLTEYLLSL